MILQREEQEDDVLQQFYEYSDSQLLKLQIKESTIPNAGLGLFATKEIQNGQIIAEAYGTVMRTRNSQDRQFWYQKTMFLIDSLYCVNVRSPCSKTKDVVKWEPEKYKTTEYDVYRQQRSFPKHEGHQRNAMGQQSPKQKSFLMARKKIMAGQQIHMKFCFQYWDFWFNLYEQSKTKPL